MRRVMDANEVGPWLVLRWTALCRAVPAVFKHALVVLVTQSLPYRTCGIQFKHLYLAQGVNKRLAHFIGLSSLENSAVNIVVVCHTTPAATRDFGGW